jgi:hypothetical protein
MVMHHRERGLGCRCLTVMDTDVRSRSERISEIAGVPCQAQLESGRR